jgi:hypothetical protein
MSTTSTDAPDAKRKRPRTYRIYVIELDEAVGAKRRVRDRNPSKRPDKPWLYVGYTVHTPEERFTQHMNGIHDAPLVRKHGMKLRLRLYENAPVASTRSEAEELEGRWAERLRRRGFGVWEGRLGPVDPKQRNE